MRAVLAAATVLATVATACGGTGPGAGAATADGLLPRCEDLAEVSPPAELVADGPVYVGNEQPIEQVLAWAEPRPGFEEIWIDRDRNGWLVVGFSEQLEEARAEAAERFDGAGVAAVEVERSLTELLALQEQVHERSPLVQGSSANVRIGRVELHVAYLTDETHAELSQEFAGEAVCVSGGDPADTPPEGPQQQAGDGWRLLASEKGAAPPFSTGVATTPEQVRRELGAAGVGTADVEIDLDQEVLVWFGVPYGSSCDDLRFDGIVLGGDADDRLLYADVVDTSGAMACTSDLAGGWAFVVAVDRSVLPSGPLTVQLDADGPPGGFPEEATAVDADLSAAGATASDDQLGPRAPDPTAGLVHSGDTVEPGFATEYLMYVHCGVGALGELNDLFWVTEDEELWYGGIPGPWQGLVDDEREELVVEVVLESGDPPRVTASANGHSVDYVPGDPAEHRCD